MAVTFEVDNDTPDRELAAIACLIAVLRSDGPIPAPPTILFDYGDKAEEPAPVAPPAAAPAPAPAAPPPPSAPAAADPPAASDALIQQEAARAAGAAGELDINGIPWDVRIHAGTKVRNADQSWRLKRGADPALVTSVTAELKAAADAAKAAQPPAADAPPPPTEPGPATAADAATAFGAAGAGGASDAPAPPAADAPAPPADGESLQEKMAGVAAVAGAPAAPAADPPAAPAADAIEYPQIITRANDAGLDYDTLNGLAVGVGLAKFMDLPKRPDLFPLFVAAMEAKIAEGPATPAA